jgi:ArsR family transcriptional regulator
METTLLSLRAVAETSRLRLLALLENGEASVGELVLALEQSQPRVSRHLKLLVAAGLVENFRDNHHVYYRLTRDGALAELLQSVLAGVARDPEVLADRARLATARQALEKDAYNRMDTKQARAKAFRPAAEQGVTEAALDDALAGSEIGDFLNIRAGSGRLLMHLAPKAKTTTGVDRSQAMRMLARSRVQQAGLAKCTLRNVEGNTLPFSPRSFDTVLLNEALGRAGNQRQALAEASRVLRADGQLLILDRIETVARQNTSARHRHERGEAPLAENHLRALLAEQGLTVSQRSWLPGKSPDYALFVAVRQHALEIGAA